MFLGNLEWMHAIQMDTDIDNVYNAMMQMNDRDDKRCYRGPLYFRASDYVTQLANYQAYSLAYSGPKHLQYWSGN